MNKAFRIFKITVLFTISTIFVLSIVGYIYLYVILKGPETTEYIPINNGKDSFVMNAYKQSEKKSIDVWTYKP
jgi:hypothetical protein